MILGLGTDIVENSRFDKWIEDKGLLERYFTPAEIKLCLSKPNPRESFAVRFAAKEALIKAAGVGFVLPLKEIEILNGAYGRSQLTTKGKVKALLEDMGANDTVHISLSHETHYSTASVILERQ